MPDGILQEMNFKDACAFKPEVVAMGLGSVEPHGAHMPYGTDYLLADGILRHAVPYANRNNGRVLMYPTLPVGVNANMKQFPFSCRVRVRTYMDTLLDIIESLEEDGVRKIFLLVGHGGNMDPVRSALRAHFERKEAGERAFVCAAMYHSFLSPEIAALVAVPHPAGDHGAEEETSSIMYLQPGLVTKENITPQPVGKPLYEPQPAGKIFYVRPWHLHIPASAGGGGDPRLASAEKGEKIISNAAENIGRFLADLSGKAWRENFPY